MIVRWGILLIPFMNSPFHDRETGQSGRILLFRKTPRGYVSVRVLSEQDDRNPGRSLCLVTAPDPQGLDTREIRIIRHNMVDSCLIHRKLHEWHLLQEAGIPVQQQGSPEKTGLVLSSPQLF